MKRTKLIEYTLIVIAAIFGYKFFETLFSLVIQMVASLNVGGLDLSSLLLPLVLVCGGYLAAFVFLVRKSREIAIYLNGNNAEETLAVKIGKKALLHLIILGISIATILYALPDVLILLYEALETKKSQGSLSDSMNFSFEREHMAVKIVRLLIAVVVLVCSKDIATWFLKNDGNDELILEAEAKDENTNS